MNKIAIIEDDIDICNMIAKFLENNKYIVHYALNGAEGIELCKSLVPDLIILDIMLPKLNGNDVLQRLRKFTNAPVIVVSAKTMVQTKIDLLKLGADDYMTKPFDLHELLARIEANLKRTSNTSCQNDTLTYRDIEINNSLVYIKEVLVSFTSTELKILRLLLQYPQKIFSKQNLYESIWNETYACLFGSSLFLASSIAYCISLRISDTEQPFVLAILFISSLLSFLRNLNI